MTTTTAEKIHLSPNTGRWETCGAEKGGCPFQGTAHITDPAQVVKMLDLQKEMDGIAKAAARDAKGNPFNLPTKHTYDAPSYDKVASPYHGVQAAYKGSKYTGYEDIKTIKAKFDADVKEAKAKGFLPKDLEVRSTIDRSGWTSKLNVDIRGAKDEYIYQENTNEWGRRPLTPEAAEVERRVGLLANAYKRDDSDSQTDTFNTNMYVRVHIEDDDDLRVRMEEAARTKRAAEGRKRRPILVENIQAAASPEAYFQNFPFTNQTKDGLRSFALLPGTQFVALKWDRPQIGGGFKAQYELYDLSPIEVLEGASLEQAIANTKFATIGRRYTKVWPEKPTRRSAAKLGLSGPGH